MAHYFSRFLHSMRLEAGFESVSEYLKSKKLTISEAYYRALEAGTKSGKQIMMDTAIELCDALLSGMPENKRNEKKRQFFLHLLKDTLPEAVYADLVRPIPLESFGNLAERQKALLHDLEIYQQDAAWARAATSFVPDDDVVTFLEDKIEWLPIIHFIHFVKDFDQLELDDICRRNNISETSKTIIPKLMDLKIIRILHSKTEQLPRYSRMLPWFRLPMNKAGEHLKNKFLIEETEKSINLGKGIEFLDSEKTFIDSGIDVFSQIGSERIKKRVRDLLAEISASSESTATERGEVTPYFFSLIVSPRPEYLPKSKLDLTLQPTTQKQLNKINLTKQ